MTTLLAALLGAALGAGLLLAGAPVLLGAPHGSTRPASPGRLADRLARAGFTRFGPQTFVAVSAAIGLAVGAVALAVTGLPIVAVIAAAGGGLSPWFIAGWRVGARIRAARGLWPEAVDHLVAAVRAGQPLPDALASLATLGPVPFRPGFALFERRWRETGTVGVALDATKAHFADPTADRLLEIIRMAREVGGSELPGVLRDLALHLRQDLALRAEAEARQSWVTNAGKLGVAAPWVVLLMLTTRPEAARAYNTPAGTGLILGALALSLVAYRIMLLVGRLPEDRRWFR